MIMGLSTSKFRKKNMLAYPLSEDMIDNLVSDLNHTAIFEWWEEAPIKISFSWVYTPTNGEPMTYIDVSFGKLGNEWFSEPFDWRKGHMPLGEFKEKTWYDLEEIGIEEC